uniref:Uncharacterized protein n=1 Tax=Zea mays TaxID=4577 RepID=B6TM07_MAIZE|nr:hypothetical protein [Zea mays]|eukprot:NP_001144132.1 Glycosyltransferase family 61 protein [Zea mays]
MGSPKAAKSMVKQRIWRHRLVAPFAAVLITAVVVFSGLFAQDPSATSEFTAVNAGNTLPVRDKSESTGAAARGSPNKEDLATAAFEQELDVGNSEPKLSKAPCLQQAREGQQRQCRSNEKEAVEDLNLKRSNRPHRTRKEKKPLLSQELASVLGRWYTNWRKNMSFVLCWSLGSQQTPL